MRTNIKTFFRKRIGLEPTAFQDELFDLFEANTFNFKMRPERGAGRTTGANAVAMYCAMHGLKVCIVVQDQWTALRHALRGTKNVTIVPYTKCMRGFQFDVAIMDNYGYFTEDPDVVAGRVIRV